jgi:hypothetical protein
VRRLIANLTSILAVALLGVVGCSDDPPDWLAERQPGGVELPGTGAELHEGLVVPDGARLLGTVFSDAYGDTPPEENWTASLFVDGDPVEVMAQLTDQAQALGLEASYECGISDSEFDGGLWCVLDAHRDVDGLRYEWLTGELRRTTATSIAYSNHANLRYSRWPQGTDLGVGERTLTPPGTLQVPAAATPPAIPSEGQLVAAEEDFRGYPLVEVVPGSTVVAPVETDICATGGFAAFLLITGDVEEVVRSYARQIDSDDLELTETRAELDGRPTIRAYVDESGGGDLTLDVVVGEGDEPTWARLSRCND